VLDYKIGQYVYDYRRIRTYPCLKMVAANGLWSPALSSCTKDQKRFSLTYLNSRCSSWRDEYVESICRIELGYWYKRLCL